MNGRTVNKSLAQRLKAKLSKPSSDALVPFAVPGATVFLPPDHALPRYQREHRLYDRFLPHLARFLRPGATVVDVGANCGDTLAAMWGANQGLEFICIEPDQEFFNLLAQNSAQLKGPNGKATVRNVQSLIGKAISGVSLEGSKGTKKAVVTAGGGSMSSTTLDAVLASNDLKTLQLIKSDVDGFDYDVIDSADASIAAAKPLLFFECQTDHSFQLAGYLSTITRLIDQGYRHWVLFDNFGEVVTRTGDVRQIEQLFGYVWRQNAKRSTRTIYYFDVLACTEKDLPLVDQVISEYLVLS